MSTYEVNLKINIPYSNKYKRNVLIPSIGKLLKEVLLKDVGNIYNKPINFEDYDSTHGAYIAAKYREVTITEDEIILKCIIDNSLYHMADHINIEFIAKTTDDSSDVEWVNLYMCFK